jgi:hypothetical protein
MPFIRILFVFIRVCSFIPSVNDSSFCYTGRFIMHSGITKIYDRKTVGHVFTKPAQIEGTTQTFFPRKLFFIVVQISAARRCEFM